MRWSAFAGLVFVGLTCVRASTAVGQGKLQVGTATSTTGSSAELAGLLKEMRDDQRKHAPELASSLGDRRYNQDLSDLSPRAYNDELARGRAYLARLSMIDPAALSASEKITQEQTETRLVQQEEGAKSRMWEMPFDSSGAVPAALAAKVSSIPFETVKDYDDWVVRLEKVPAQMRQVTENIMAGLDDKRLQPAQVLEAAVKQARAIAESKAEETVFAEPLRKFPASIAPEQRNRITAATVQVIRDEVQPAYARLVRFLRGTSPSRV